MAKIQDEVVETTQKEPTMAEILALVQSQQKEIERLKKNDTNSSISDNIEKAKEKFSGQLHASYWLWGWVPVLWIKTVKRDSEFPLQYKNHLWYTINNHYLDVTLANGKISKMVNRDEFDTSKVLSDKVPFSVIHIEDGEEVRVNKVTPQNIVSFKNIKNYVFNDETYWEILVSNNCIN